MEGKGRCEGDMKRKEERCKKEYKAFWGIVEGFVVFREKGNAKRCWVEKGRSLFARGA